MWDPYAEFRMFVLGNGLRVFYLTMPERKWEHFSFVVHAGSLDDPRGRNGLAHFVEHMVSENIPGIKAAEVERFLDLNSGGYNLGSTTAMGTQYGCFLPLEDAVLKQAIDVFGSMLLDAKLVKRIDPEREAIRMEYFRRFPVDVLYRTVARRRKALFGNTRFGRFVRPLGSMAAIKKISAADLQDFYDRYYCPKNISVVAVGGLDERGLRQLLEHSSFATEKSGDFNDFPEPPEELNLDIEKEVIDLGKYLKVKVAEPSFTSATALPADGYKAIRIMQWLFSDKLLNKIRRKMGSTYSVDSQWLHMGKVGEFSIVLDRVKAGVVDQVDPIIGQTLEEIVSDWPAVENAKKSLILGLQMTDAGGGDLCATAASDLLKYHRIISVVDEVRDIANVTRGDIEKIADLFQKRRVTIEKS